eukprot:gene141-226_t
MQNQAITQIKTTKTIINHVPKGLNSSDHPFSIDIETSEFSEKVLLNAIENHDSTLLRKLIINISGQILIEEVGKVIDNFLVSRPWWRVEKEPYTWSPTESTLKVVFTRYSTAWEAELQFIAKTQYPTNCNNTLLSVELTSRFHEWGNAFYNYGSVSEHYTHAIFSPFVADPHCHDVAYLDKEHCPSDPNKYTTAFLPTTNCTLPHQLVKCGIKSCKLHGNHFTNATEFGHILTDPEFWAIVEKDRENYKDDEIRSISFPHYGYRGTYNMTTILKKSHDARSREILFTYGILLRLNYKYRSLVAHEIFNFETKLLPLKFPTDGNCVTIHIRRTDRIAAKHDYRNMTEWCDNHSGRVSSTMWHDMGCNLGIPFGDVTLRMFLNASNIIKPAVRNVYIMTDDGDWVKKHMKEYENEWNFFLLPAPSNHRKGSLVNGVNFLSSIELAKRCNGLVGHTGSAIMSLLLRIMLNTHASTNISSSLVYYDFASSNWDRRRRKR